MNAPETIAENTQLPTMKGNFENQETEYEYWVEDIDGTIPADFTGTFFRNGPGRLTLNGEGVRNWFDCDGMVARTTFVGGKAHFANKFVRTAKYVDETAANKYIYRGFGGAPKGNFFKRFSPPANPANTSLILHGGKFLAMNEGARPYALDPTTLDTEEGEFTYNDALSKQNMFSAHGKINPKTGCFYNFGMSFEASLKGLKPGFDFYKISPGGQLVARAKFALDFMPLLHDFALTENYAIFIQSSVAMPENMLGLILKNGSMADAMTFDTNKTSKIIIINVHTLQLVDKIEIDPVAALHFGNAYEKNGEIHFDMMETKPEAYPTPSQPKAPFDIFDPNVQAQEGAGLYTRFVINLRKASVIKERINDALEGEFPQWDWRLSTAENRYAVSAAYPSNSSGTYFSAVQKIDRLTGKVAIHDFGAFRFNGEPLMVAKPAAKSEDEFYVLVYVYNGNTDKTEIVLLDSENFDDEIAVIKLNHHLPQGFHGLFSPKIYL
jgi:all-trans-8'-apo-beta-carotenal 15,15'-oxygenase